MFEQKVEPGKIIKMYHENRILDKFFGCLLVTIFVNTPLLIIAAWTFTLMFRSWVGMAFLIVLHSSPWWPKRHDWKAYRRSHLMRTWLEFFRYRFVVDYDITAHIEKHGDRSIHLEFPHGAYPMGPVLAALVAEMFTGGRMVYGMGASVVFKIPLWAHMYSYYGMKEVTRENIIEILNQGKACAITPGGISEMFLIYPDKDVLYFNKRKGYIRLALETGADLIPVYHFGNNLVYSFGPKWLRQISRKFRVSIGYLQGTFGLPIPRPISILTAVGRPILVEKMSRFDPKFKDRVLELQQEVKSRTLELFEKYKASFHPTWSTRRLEFV